MGRTTFPGDEKQGEDLNVGQQHSDRRFNDSTSKVKSAEEKGTFNDIVNNNYSQDEKNNLNKIAESESQGSWADKTDTPGRKIPFSGTLKAYFKKRGGIIGLIVALAIGGGAVGTFFGPASMLINLTENATSKNDTSSTALQHRFMKVFGFVTNSSDPICKNSSKSIKCKMGQISNKALDKLEKKGITPQFADAVDNNDRKSTGYPNRNPTAYTIDLKDGSTPQTIPREQFLRYIADHPKVAAKVLGRSGAFNVRINAWAGKNITDRLYSIFNLERRGGIADGSGRKLSPVEKLAAATEKLKERIPGGEKVAGVTGDLERKIRGHLGKAGKAGGVYTGVVASCIAVKAPAYIAAGVAAVQLLQVMPVGMDLILSPGAKTKASGVDTKNSITPEDADAVGTLLTNESPNKDDGKMASALSSPVLLAAIGVNTAKAAIPKDVTPGYSVLTSPLVKSSRDADKQTKAQCNAVMSPAAMYTAMAVSSGVTIALSTTLLGGVIKVVADYLTSIAITEIAVGVGKAAAEEVFTDLATNTAIPDAKGKELGDVAGVSLMSMFAAGGMSRNLPVLKESEVAGFNVAALETEAYDRETEIATLSPFDTSSKYTFLGSIVNNARLAVLKSGSYNGSILSSLPGLMNFSFASFTTNTKAADDSATTYCSYAEDFGLEADNPADTPGITLSGLPCTGLTPNQLGMDTQTGIDLMIKEGWVDESVPISDTDMINELVEKEFIRPETPLADYIESCGNAATGDYLLNSTGCTVTSSDVTPGAGSELPPLKDQRSLEAMAVFLLDYQQAQALNGNDEEGAESTAPVASDAFVLPTDVGYKVSYGWGPRSCAGCSKYHKGMDITNFAGGTLNKPVYSVADGVVMNVVKANGINGNCTGGGNGSNNVLNIKHANGVISSYWHMSANNISVNTGDIVTAGQQVGKIGNCGDSYGAHLHFETWVDGITDPALLAISGADAADNKRNPAKVMAVLGVDMMNGTYTDGR